MPCLTLCILICYPKNNNDHFNLQMCSCPLGIKSLCCSLLFQNKDERHAFLGSSHRASFRFFHPQGLEHAHLSLEPYLKKKKNLFIDNLLSCFLLVFDLFSFLNSWKNNYYVLTSFSLLNLSFNTEHKKWDAKLRILDDVYNRSVPVPAFSHSVTLLPFLSPSVGFIQSRKDVANV